MQYSKNNPIVYVILVGIMIVGLAQTARASETPQGLISRLIKIKYSTELYLSYQIKKESGRTQSEIDSALANYNTIRWKVDGLVYQLSSELIMRNSPAIMRRLETWSYGKFNSKTPKSIQQYVAQFEEIDRMYQLAIASEMYPNNKRTLNLTTNVFYLLKDSYSIIKGLSDIKTEKVMALVELLDNARLMGPGEVMKMGK
jgi:hypothetical protein